MNAEEKAQREKIIVEMYKSGVSTEKIAKDCHVAQSTIKDIAIRHKVYIPNRNKFLNQKRYGKLQDQKMELGFTSKSAEKLRTAITHADIKRIRDRIKPGDKLYISTSKAADLNGTHGGDVHRPIIREATVLSTKNPSFCLVKIENTGLTETVGYVDIEMARRKGKNYV